MARVDGSAYLQALLVVLARVDDLEPLRHLPRDLSRDLAVARSGDHRAAVRVRDDRLELGLCQPPVERDRDGSDLACREQQLDDLRRGAVEVRDPISGADAGREQRLAQPVRAFVELGVGERARAAAKGHDVPTIQRVLPHDVRHPEMLKNLH